MLRIISVLVVFGLSEILCGSSKQQRTFEIRWPNNTVQSFTYDYKKESECIYDGYSDRLICMRNFDYSRMVSRWIYNRDVIEYVSVRCLEQQFFAHHKHACLCKNAAMAANPHQNKQRDEFSYCQITGIPPNVFDSLSNLEFLDVSSNLITNLTGVFTKKFEMLRFLNISHNPIQVIPEGFFCGMDNLKVILMQKLSLETFPWQAFSCTQEETSEVEMIDLSSSHISEIPDQSFENIQQLLYLNLSNNLLKSLPPSPFLKAGSLIYLDLSENFISEIVEDFCAGMHSLQKIYLRGNSFQITDATPFSRCSKLQFIDISKNRIDNFTPTSHPQPELKILNLSDNDLIEIKPRMFTVSYPNLEYLDISENDLSSLQNNAFSGLTNLQYLNVSWNRIQISTSEVGLNGLSKLQTLVLNNNMISAVDGNLFFNMTKLRHLSLQYNHISDLSRTSFLSLSSLQILRMDNNHIVSVPDNIFVNCNSLNTLNLSRNEITTVRSIQFPSSLEELDLSFNKLVDMPKNMANIKWLSLRGNQITHLTKSTFVNLSGLENLDISFNKVHILEAGAFDGLFKLKFLDLSHNFIQLSEYSQVFPGMFGLEVLDLTYNNITSVNGLFKNNSLNSLLVLHLSNNPIRHLTYSLNQAGNVKQLQRFHCQNCQLVNVANDVFMNFTKLMVVDFSRNNLSEFDPFISNRDITYDMYENPVICSCKMKWLSSEKSKNYKIKYCIVYPKHRKILLSTVPIQDYLCEIKNVSSECSVYSHEEGGVPKAVMCVNTNRHNVPSDLPVQAEIIYLDGNNFWDTGSIKKIGNQRMKVGEIYLNNSRISGLDKDVFSNMPLLKIIDISHNFIHKVNPDLFKDLLHLQTVRLNLNRIKMIEPGLFHGLLSLQVIDIRANKLEHLLPATLGELSSIPEFRWIYLSRNPWKCDCSNRHFRDWIFDYRSRIYDRRHLYCGKEEIIKRDISAFECRKSYFMAVGVAVVASCCMLLVLVLCIAFFCFRRIIIALLYSRLKLKSFHCSKSFRLKHNYKYDVVVIFDENDSKCRWWVNKTLLPRLTQHNWNFKVYVANMDLRSQDQLLHDIRNNIQHSQSTLFVISKNFPCSYVCMMSLRYARFEAAMTGHTVLFIAWGEFTREILESDASEYIRKGEYLKIREKFVVDKLICLLPTPISDNKTSSAANHHPRASITSSLNNLILNTSFDSTTSQ